MDFNDHSSEPGSLSVKKRFAFFIEPWCFFEFAGPEERTWKQILTLVFIYREEHITIINRAQKPFDAYFNIPDNSIFENVELINSWRKVDLNNYEFIIVHPDLQSSYLEWIGLSKEFENIAIRSFSLKNYHHTSSKLSSINKLLHQFPGNRCRLELFKSQIDLKYSLFVFEAQPVFDKLQKKINSFFQSLKNTEVLKIGIISGFYQKFFIGDSCFWFYEVQQYLHLILNRFPYAKIQIFHTDPSTYERLKSIYENSFPKGVMFTNCSIPRILEKEVDLFVVNQREFFKIYEAGENAQFIPNMVWVPFYHKTKEPDFPTELAFTNFFQFDSLQEKLKYNKKYYLTLPLTDNEIKWGNKWLEKQNVFRPKVIIMPYNASTQEKLLRSSVFFEIVSELIQRGFSVLTFDEKGVGLMQTFSEALPPEVMAEVIIVNGIGGIRNEMALMSSDYIVGLISPCTGIAHIFNGIRLYRKVRNKNGRFYLIYTGKAPENDPEYHPLNWWQFSDIFCLTNIYNSDGYRLVSKKDIPQKVSLYRQLAAPVNTLSSDQILDFIHPKMFDNATQ